ncbi:MAG: phosphatidylglycerophosphatase A [Pseudomonadota bacterium]
MSKIIATFGYVGLIRPAPGTWGSLAALLVAWPIHVLGGPLLLLAATAVALAIGLWATRDYMAATGTHDPSEVVIDEVVGQWIALLPASLGAAHSGAAIPDLWPGILVAFLAFRALDIAKPGPIGWADQQPGAWGVMLDDIIAGWMAALLVAVTAFVAHGLIGV